MDQVAKVTVVALGVVAFLAAILTIGVYAGRHQVWREAHQAGCGEWVLNENGAAEFWWKAGE